MKLSLKKKLLSGLLAVSLLVSALPAGFAAFAASSKAGTPYKADGNYDVAVPHVVVNQVYGASNDGYASHSFIELYNCYSDPVDLNGWELQYKASEDGNGTKWEKLSLNGTIPGNGYYLIRCGAVDTQSGGYQVTAGDMEWNIQLHNKGVAVVLLSKSVTLSDNFTGAVTDANRPDGYVDTLAIQGNGKKAKEMPPVYEGEVSQEQSKKKAVRRVGFADTDNNKNDVEIIDYSKSVAADKAPHTTKDGGNTTPSKPVTFRTDSFETGAALTLNRLSSTNIGEPNADGGVAEIVAYNADKKEAYAVNGQDGLLCIFGVSDNGLTLKEKKSLKNTVVGFAYGDMTSVAVDTVNDRIAVALQAEGYADNGRVVLFDYDFKLINAYEVGVQPDMVTFTNNGRMILSADEGEPRMGYGEGAVDPDGSVSIIDLMTGKVTKAGFEGFDSAELVKAGVIIGKANGKLNSAAADLEPEYIAVSDDDTMAYVSLQEANAIAAVDLKAKKVLSVKSLGFKDLSREENAIDLNKKDGTYAPDTYENAVGVYMPDSITAYTVNGKTYILTANEGDSRDWQDYLNEKEITLIGKNGTEAKKVLALDKDVTAVPDESKEYLFGGRSFSIYEADTMKQIYDSGNDFEKKTAEYLPDYFNCSNDKTELDGRSPKKGPEPETVITGKIGDKTYAFIALERIGGVMVYDVTDTADVKYVNYINTRDFSDKIKEDVSPEGLCFLLLDGKPMLLAACEVSGTVAAYGFGGSATGNAPAESENTTPINKEQAVVLYTNDVHSNLNGYSALAAYRRQMLDNSLVTVTVDAGDAVQGELSGMLTKGAAASYVMNSVGYDIAVPGNHEFDYGMDRFKELTGQTKGEVTPDYEYISANFTDLNTGKSVLKPYVIKDMAGKKVAFVGISTPETYTKSTPDYFKDENGKFIYSFSENNFYETVQAAVDNAKNDGADIVIAVGHLGIDDSSEPYRSTDVIANTTGINAFIDGHSHSSVESQNVKAKDGTEVLLTQTGEKLKGFGKMVINSDGTITAELIKTEDVATDATEGSKEAYDATKEVIDFYNGEVDKYGNQKAGISEVNMSSAKTVVRTKENNLGNFASDAYRARTGADIAFSNGGGLRADIKQGEILNKDLINVNIFGNDICVLKATGQQILDALEWSAHAPLTEDGKGLTANGGFLHASGLTYEIDLTVKESPVTIDDKGTCTGIDSSKPRRVKNVKVGGKAIDPQAYYTVAGSQYTLKQGGDGYTAFKDAEIIRTDCGKDYEQLIAYTEKDLNGVIPTSLYGNENGEGRIKFLTEEDVKADQPTDDGKEDEAPAEDNKEDNSSDNAVESKPEGEEEPIKQTGDSAKPLVAAAITLGAMAMLAVLTVKKRKYSVK